MGLPLARTQALADHGTRPLTAGMKRIPPNELERIADELDEATTDELDDLLTALMYHCWPTRDCQDG